MSTLQSRIATRHILSMRADPRPHRLSDWTSASVFLFFLLTLSIPSGYSIGGVLLWIGGIAIWLHVRTRRGPDSDVGGPHQASWTAEDRTLCGLLLLVFLVSAVTVAWHGDSTKYLDQGIRYLLVIPVLYGLRQVRVRLKWAAVGLVFGLIGTAVVAWWQIHVQGIERATGFVTSAIPFGDIALTMSFWCFMLAALAAIRRKPAWCFALIIGTLAGLYAMMASATRGSLVAIPIFVILASIALWQRRHIRVMAGGLAILAAAVVIGLSTLSVGQNADERYADVLTEWQQYTQFGDATNNVGSRLEAWKAALISIPEHPFLGWGYEAYDAHLQELIAAGRIDPFVATLSNTHNNFIEVWLHQGTISLIALLGLLGTSFWFFCRRLRAPDPLVRVLACCGASLPASFAAYGLTQVILGRNNGVMFFLVSLAILWAAMRQAEADAAWREAGVAMTGAEEHPKEG